WKNNFFWSAPSFMVAGAAGAMAAIVILRGDHWLAMLMLAPVYLTYRSYQVFLGRIDDQRRHVEETETLHGQAIEALRQARLGGEGLGGGEKGLGGALRRSGGGGV